MRITNLLGHYAICWRVAVFETLLWSFLKLSDLVCSLFCLVYQLGKGFFTSSISLNVNRVVHLSSFAFWSPSSAILPALVFNISVSESERLSPSSLFVMWACLKAISEKSRGKRKLSFLFNGYKWLSSCG